MCGRAPVDEDEFLSWFDADGRLVREASMRQAVFEGEMILNSFFNTPAVIHHPSAHATCACARDSHTLTPHPRAATVVPSCRRSLWKFLFRIFPMNSTYR